MTNPNDGDHAMTAEELKAEVEKFVQQNDPGDESDAWDNWHDGALINRDEVKDTHPLDQEEPVLRNMAGEEIAGHEEVAGHPAHVTPRDVIKLLKQNKHAITHLAVAVLDTDGQVHVLSDDQPLMVRTLLAHALNANLMSVTLKQGN